MSGRRLISTGSPFEANVAYSRAVVADGWVFLAGTTGYDYATMTMPDDIVDQCRNTLQTIQATLQDAGASLADIVRITYILPNKDDFPACWPVLREYLGDIRPAATMIQAGLQEPEMKIEIEVTARIGSAG